MRARLSILNIFSTFAVSLIILGHPLHAAKKSQKKSATDRAAKESIEEAKKGLRTTGPADLEMPVTEKSMDFSAAADAKRNESIREIQSILPKVKGAQKGELVFRLAELYWEKAKFLNRQEFDNFDRAHQAWFDGGEKGKEPKLKNYVGESKAYKKQALANYKVVLQEFPEYPRLDEVLFIMAQNEYDAGNKKEGTKHYSKLIRKYPKSVYVADSYLALGEHYFGLNKLAKATKAYKFAYDVGKRMNKPSTYRYAQYKLAWTDYNRQDFDSALVKFKAVVEDSEKAASEANGQGAVQLKREALNDMVLTFAQVNQVRPAYDYFVSKAGKEEGYRLTTKLAAVFNNQGMFDSQIETLRLILALDPNALRAPDYQSQIVAAYSKMQERDAVRSEVTKLVQNYGPTSSWAKANSGDEMAVERATAIAEERMRDLVTEYHEYAQKFEMVSDYELARDLYSQYVKAFPNSDQAYNLNYYFAEILWDLGQWEDAANQYDAVVAKDPKGRYTRDSAYNAILAWEKIVDGVAPPKRAASGKLVRSKRGRKSGKVKKKTVKMEEIKKDKTYAAEIIPEAELKLANACDAYVAVVPESLSRKNKALTKELVVVKFKAGYIFQKYYHFDEAAKRFGELIDRFPTTEFARRGADSILDSYDARSQWANLEKWSREFSKNKALMKDKPFAARVGRFLQGASYNQSTIAFNEVSKKHGDTSKVPSADVAEGYRDVIKSFDAYLGEFGKSEFAPKAAYNQYLAVHRLGEVDNSLPAAQRILATYKKSLDEGELSKVAAREGLEQNILGYLTQMANYQEAADASYKFANDYPNNESAADILYNSGIYYLGLGDSDKATKSFQAYLKKYPKRTDRAEVYLKVARVAEDQKSWTKAAEIYQKFPNKFPKATIEQKLRAHYKTASIRQNAGNEKGMKSACKKLLATYKKDDLKKSDIGKEAGGFCAFHLLDDDFKKYEKITITGNIKNKLALKKKERDRVAKSYFDVLNYGNGEWGIAGLYRSAEILLQYVDTLRNTPDPPALRDNYEALDMFRAELDNIAFPVEDEAIQALEAALAKSFELGIYSKYTVAIEEKLKLFKPGAFGEQYVLPYYATANEKLVTK